MNTVDAVKQGCVRGLHVWLGYDMLGMVARAILICIWLTAGPLVRDTTVSMKGRETSTMNG